jgi:hypothetical protein
MDTTRTIKAVFLKLLVKGTNISLYSYADNLKTRYYILEQGSTGPEELEYKVYAPIKTEIPYHAYYQTKTEVTYRKYIGQLMILAKKYKPESKELERLISNSGYIAKDIIPIAFAINGQKKETAKDYSNRKLRLVLYAGAGITGSYLRFTGNDPFAELTRVPLAYKPSFTFGITMTDKPEARAAFHVGISASYLNYKLQCSQDFSSSYYIETKTLFLKMHTLTIAPSFTYNLYNAERFKLFLGAGFYINGSIYPINYLFVKDVGQFNTNSSYSVQDAYLLKRVWYSFPLKAGIIVNNHYEISINWFLPSSLTRTVNQSGLLNDAQVTFLYHFSKK